MQKIYFDGTDQYVYFQASKNDYSGELTGTNDGDALPGAAIALREYKKTAVSVTSPEVLWNATLGYWFAKIPASYITQFGGVVLAVAGTGMFTAAIEAIASRAEDYFASAAALSTVDTVVDSLATTEDIVSIGLDVAAIKVVTDSGLATSAEITSIKGATWTDETLVTIQEAIETIEVTETGGSEKVIPATSISLNSAAKTITLSSPYDTITVEQILSIRNITENQDIYNSKVTHEGKQIHITTPGIIDYDYSGTMVDLTDIIQIIYI